MKKNTIKAFTLVEMLIVIVIIGILIAALLPRMSAAQGRARDVARKTALSQLQSAIVTYQGDKGLWPQQSLALSGMGIPYGDTSSGLASDLINAGMSSIPNDPLKESSFKGLGSSSNEITSGQYGYLVAKRNGTEKAGFVLMAKTEVEGGSNRAYCDGATTLNSGLITSSDDISKIQLCGTMTKCTTGGCCSAKDCRYEKEGELRYIVLY